MATSLKVKIIDPVGLHARPASVVVQKASKFKSDIEIHASGKKGNLKSIMGVLSLAVKKGAEVEIIAKGPDEKEAIEEIKKTMKENKLI